MLNILFCIFIILPLAICSNSSFANEFESLRPVDKKLNITFKSFLQRFEPGKVWEKIDKINKLKGINKTLTDEFEAMFNGIDETDELLKLKVQNGNPKIELRKDGRRWVPVREGPSYWDRFQLRPRLMELCKQAIYQTRYKMVIMQILRNKYKKNAVYKMGFLMSKTDIACKTLASVSFKLYRDCSNARQHVVRWFPVIDLLSGEERLLTLWFDVDLLVELVVKNDENCRRMLREVIANRKHAWKFFD